MEKRERERERERERVDIKYAAILKKLEKKRIEANFTQYDIASTLGLTESGYFKVEKGSTKLDVERLLLILDKLAISPKEFFKDFKY